MPVKVVSDAPVKTKRVTCHNCCYELEFTGEDMFSYSDGDGDCYRYIICPRASCKNSFDNKPTRISVKWP